MHLNVTFTGIKLQTFLANVQFYSTLHPPWEGETPSRYHIPRRFRRLVLDIFHILFSPLLQNPTYATAC